MVRLGVVTNTEDSISDRQDLCVVGYHIISESEFGLEPNRHEDCTQHSL